MKINGVDTKSFGLIPIEHTGFYDMPSRLGSYYYDWGDTLQPILDAEELSWSSLTYSVSFLRDDRVGGTGDFETRINNLAVLSPFQLELTEAGSGYGSYFLKMDSASNHKIYRNGDTISLNFFDREPSFVGSIPNAPSSLSPLSLGGRNFDQFGIVVTNISDKSNKGSLKTSSATAYNRPSDKTNYRSFATINLECYCVAESPNDLLQKMNNFRLFLQSPNTLELTHNGNTFDVFCSSGFKCARRNKSTVKFNLILNKV